MVGGNATLVALAGVALAGSALFHRFLVGAALVSVALTGAPLAGPTHCHWARNPSVGFLKFVSQTFRVVNNVYW